PVKQLKGFEKVELEPGESKEVEFILTPQHLSFTGIDLKPTIESGVFAVRVGNLKKEFTLK
ncbi:MAG: hypothetical protein FJW56_10845, partial [Actinobacteria bacterium]|nr:hypothetical protein [Actinomycetota bacterium]